MSAFYICLLCSVFTLTFAQKRGSFTLGPDAEKTCVSYGILCPFGKVCAVQHLQVPRPITIPVCIPEKYVPVNSEACYLPPQPGKCDAKFTRWYFNRHSKQCSWFHYGGCGGNENRFRTKEECEQTCKGARTIITAIDEKRSNTNYQEEVIESNSDGEKKIATPRLLPLEANTQVVTVPNIAKTRRSWLKKKRICGKNCNRRRSHKSRRTYRKNSPGLTRRRKSDVTPKTPIAFRIAPSASRTYNDDRIGANRFLPGGASVHKLFSLLQPAYGSASWRRYRS